MKCQQFFFLPQTGKSGQKLLNLIIKLLTIKLSQNLLNGMMLNLQILSIHRHLIRPFLHH